MINNISNTFSVLYLCKQNGHKETVTCSMFATSIGGKGRRLCLQPHHQEKAVCNLGCREGVDKNMSSTHQGKKCEKREGEEDYKQTHREEVQGRSSQSGSIGDSVSRREADGW